MKEFKCYNGQCISGDKLCDLKMDCFDGSDERFCGMCHVADTNTYYADRTNKYSFDELIANVFYFSKFLTIPNPFHSPPLSDANCNFEEGVCGWHNLITDVFDWTRFRGETASYGTGPRVDHTTLTEEGYYMYIETSLPRKLGDYAILQSHWLSLTGTNCVLSLFYHMEVKYDFNGA